MFLKMFHKEDWIFLGLKQYKEAFGVTVALVVDMRKLIYM